MKRSEKNILGILMLIPFLVITTVTIVKGINFNRYCGGHLKRAADANTVELARQELATAITYAEQEGLTTGYTSIVYNTPDEDIGFWYTNLRASLQELDSLNATSSQLEKSNMLLKLRQTLLDHTESGENVTKPSGISVYPNNLAYAVWGLITMLMGLIAFGVLFESNA